jgi:hypothetical protein
MQFSPGCEAVRAGGMNCDMKLHTHTIIAALLLCGPAFAKDEPIGLDACPPRVQAVIRQYTATYGKFEEVELDRKKKTGGPPVYEAKFEMPNRRRVEVHISASGQVLKVEEKQPKQ